MLYFLHLILQQGGGFMSYITQYIITMVNSFTLVKDCSFSSLTLFVAIVLKHYRSYFNIRVLIRTFFPHHSTYIFCSTSLGDEALCFSEFGCLLTYCVQEFIWICLHLEAYPSTHFKHLNLFTAKFTRNVIYKITGAV